MMLTLPYIQKDFQEPRLLICKEEFSNTWISRKKCGEGSGLSGSKPSTGRQWELQWQERAEEDLWGRQLLCLSAYSTSTAMPTLLLLLAFSVSMPRTQSCLLFPLVICKSTPTFALVNTGWKGRKEAWLPSDLALRRPLLFFSELGKSAIFLP